jgi:hypothetical protein
MRDKSSELDGVSQEQPTEPQQGADQAVNIEHRFCLGLIITLSQLSLTQLGDVVLPRLRRRNPVRLHARPHYGFHASSRHNVVTSSSITLSDIEAPFYWII